jgi:hypothetical protein
MNYLLQVQMERTRIAIQYGQTTVTKRVNKFVAHLAKPLQL